MLKNNIYFCFLYICLINLFYLSIPKYKIGDIFLDGTWIGKLKNNNFKLRLNSNKTFQLTISNKNESQIFSYDGLYEHQIQKSPSTISLIKIKGLNHPLHSVFRLINSDSIRIAFFSNKNKFREINITDNNSFGLKRNFKKSLK
jgi:hypothetical protein